MAKPPQLALIRPNANLRDSYCALIAEFVANGDALVPFTLSFDHTDFDKFLTKLDDCYRGVGIPNGFVPHSTFWLVRGGNEVVGVSNIRHTLTPALLREGGHIGYGIRPAYRRQGLGIAILRNGGILESEEYVADRGEVVQRYWIAPASIDCAV